MDMQIPRNILLNPGPATTTDSVKFSQVVPDICPREAEFGNLVEWIQEQLVTFAGSRENNVCVLMGGSGTSAVEMVISSVIPEDGGLLVVNNGAYGERIVKMAKIHHIPTIEFESSTCKPIDTTLLSQKIEEAQSKLKAQGKKLTHLALIHHETTSGLLNDTAEIGAICKKYNLDFILDAMSSYGAMPMDMDYDNIHYLISSSNKNVQGMAGIGIILCNKERLESTSNIPMRTLYLNLYDQYQHFLKTKQFRFTPPVQTVYALRQAVEETLAEGINARYSRYRECYTTLRAKMQEIGFSVLVADEHSSGFITTFFEPKDEQYSFDSMHDYLYERGFTIYPGKVSVGNTFRIANIGDLDVRDMQNFIDCLQSYLNENQIKLFS